MLLITHHLTSLKLLCTCHAIFGNGNVERLFCKQGIQEAAERHIIFKT